MALQWGRMVRDLSQARQAASDGFEFVHASADLVARLSDEPLHQEAGSTGGDGVPFAVCEVPLPANVRVTQKGFNVYVWTEHLRKAAHRMAGLGCRTLVWSDGRARLLPVEGEVAGFKDQVLQLLFMLCEVASTFDMTVLVEPLGTRRTNFLNTMREVGEVVDRVGKANLAGVISLREMEPIGLSLSELPSYRELIGHVQMDRPGVEPDPRRSPRPGDGCDYRPFLRALKGMGYSGRISLPDDADAAALAYCRQLWSD